MERHACPTLFVDIVNLQIEINANAVLNSRIAKSSKQNIIVSVLRKKTYTIHMYY